ncbi:basic proline-rich protein-like isoform X2 [Gallus gallus]|uniref:basic proline-rich protein-like isoform X2 n=1 Tax=Gallus gallus TaxID=9031 RepID=UPI001AE375CE|nr:basic proline-rich protein-like isoform X2 [Gallus gallus]
MGSLWGAMGRYGALGVVAVPHRVKHFRGQSVHGDVELRVEQAQFSQLSVVASRGSVAVSIERGGAVRRLRPDFVLLREEPGGGPGGSTWRFLIGLHLGGVPASTPLQAAIRAAHPPAVLAQAVQLQKELGSEGFPMAPMRFCHRPRALLTAPTFPMLVTLSPAPGGVDTVRVSSPEVLEVVAAAMAGGRAGALVREEPPREGTFRLRVQRIGSESRAMRHRDWLSACSRLLGGAEICGLEAEVGADGSERITRVLGSWLPLWGPEDHGRVVEVVMAQMRAQLGPPRGPPRIRPQMPVVAGTPPQQRPPPQGAPPSAPSQPRPPGGVASQSPRPPQPRGPAQPRPQAPPTSPQPRPPGPQPRPQAPPIGQQRPQAPPTAQPRPQTPPIGGQPRGQAPPPGTQAPPTGAQPRPQGQPRPQTPPIGQLRPQTPPTGAPPSPIGQPRPQTPPTSPQPRPQAAPIGQPAPPGTAYFPAAPPPGRSHWSNAFPGPAHLPTAPPHWASAPPPGSSNWSAALPGPAHLPSAPPPGSAHLLAAPPPNPTHWSASPTNPAHFPPAPPPNPTHWPAARPGSAHFPSAPPSDPTLWPAALPGSAHFPSAPPPRPSSHAHHAAAPPPGSAPRTQTRTGAKTRQLGAAPPRCRPFPAPKPGQLLRVTPKSGGGGTPRNWGTPNPNWGPPPNL